MYIIEEETLGETWLEAMKIVMSKGENIRDEAVPLREIRNLYVSIPNISEDDSILKKFADYERIQLMKKKYATCGLVGDYKIDYGSYIYNNNGINQIEWIIDRLKKKEETKSATITLHKPGEKYLACLSMLDFKYRNGVLEMNAVYRSQNIYTSHPGNMLALRQIQKDVADALGWEAGKVNLIVFSAHIYEPDFEKVNDIIRASCY